MLASRVPLRSRGRSTLVILISSRSIKQEVGYYLHQEGLNLGKHRVPRLLLPSALDAQFGTPYPRSAGFDTDTCLPFSQGQVAVRTTPPIAIKMKTHGITWMVNRTHTIWNIKVEANLFKMALLAVIRVRLLSKWTRKIPEHVGCPSMIACQVSWISDEF